MLRLAVCTGLALVGLAAPASFVYKGPGFKARFRSEGV
jgi:hypothetical protein